MTFLAIDIGNTLIKAYSETDNQNFTSHFFTTIQKLIEFVNSYSCKSVNIIVSDVRNVLSEKNIHELKQRANTFIILNHETPLPITNAYETPHTLGYDRIAGVVAASNLFPNIHCLVIDAGTAITYDLITSDKTYIGGAISPGIQLRFRALNEFTGKLPLGRINELKTFPCKNTIDCIEHGVMHGVIAEINEYIQLCRQTYSPLQIIITGGDSLFLVKYVKNTIFVEPNLVAKGLINILKYNVL